MKSVYRALIVASGLALAGYSAAQESNAPPPVTPGATDQTTSAAPAVTNPPSSNPVTANPPAPATSSDTTAAPAPAAQDQS